MANTKKAAPKAAPAEVKEAPKKPAPTEARAIAKNVRITQTTFMQETSIWMIFVARDSTSCPVT